jgi:glucokinase
MFKAQTDTTTPQYQNVSISNSLSKSLSFNLTGIFHTLNDGDGIFGIDHGGSGADGFAGIYSQKLNEIQVKFRQKFGPEVSPQQAIIQLKDGSGLTPHRIVYGVASPVNNNEAPVGINVPYAVNGSVLSEVLPEHPSVLVYNDYGLVMERFKTEIPYDSLQVMQLGERQNIFDPGVITAIGPGSGLGIGRLTFLSNGKYLLEQIEGSHGRLAVRYDNKNNDIQSGLISWWTKQYGTVNSNAVLCASGLIKLFRYLVDGWGYTLLPQLKQLMDESRDSEPSAAHEDRLLLTEQALEDSDATSVAALDLFMELLGGFSQNAAFFHGLRSRNYKIYLAGGVVSGMLHSPNFIDRFGQSFINSFIHTYEDKDREWLKTIPIDILCHPRAEALHGAAIAAACMDQ